ncbi:MAG: hypothetical protein AB7K09_19670 [Planctomycetota bacterium]
MAKKQKGKVHRVVSDEKKQAIVLAAGSAHKQLRKANLVFAGIFLLAIVYLGGRVAFALISDVKISDDVVPVPFSMPTAPGTETASITPQLDAPISATELDTMRAAGLTVARDEDLQRATGSASSSQQPTRDATADEKAAFAAALANGEKLLNEQFDYTGAVKAFDRARAIANIPRFDVERAERGLNRARVYLDVTEGVVPVRDTNRFVKFQPPGGQQALIGMVAKSEPWRSGRVMMTPMNDDSLVELNVERTWTVTELQRAEVDAALAARLKQRLQWLQARKADGSVTPLDLCGAAVVILQSGDVVENGRTLPTRPLTHACLGEAFDMCEAAGCSLSDTLMLRRDPENQLLLGALTMLISDDNLLLSASDAEKTVINSRMQRNLQAAQDSLANLLRRYPAAWDFRDHKSEEMLDEFRKRIRDDMGRVDPGPDGGSPRPPVDPPPPTLPDKAKWYVDKAKELTERADGIVRRTREPDYDYGDSYRDLSQAADLYEQARENLRMALKESPDNRKYIDNMIVEVNGKLYAANKSRPLRGK